jgi:hypothetical protein
MNLALKVRMDWKRNLETHPISMKADVPAAILYGRRGGDKIISYLKTV